MCMNNFLYSNPLIYEWMVLFYLSLSRLKHVINRPACPVFAFQWQHLFQILLDHYQFYLNYYFEDYEFIKLLWLQVKKKIPTISVLFRPWRVAVVSQSHVSDAEIEKLSQNWHSRAHHVTSFHTICWSNFSFLDCLSSFVRALKVMLTQLFNQ